MQAGLLSGAVLVPLGPEAAGEAPARRSMRRSPRPPQAGHAAAPLTISVKAALLRYGIGRTKLYELLGSGVLKASKLGAKTLIDVAQADAFFAGLPAFGTQGAAAEVRPGAGAPPPRR